MTEDIDADFVLRPSTLGLRRLRTALVLDRQIGNRVAPRVSVVIPLHKRAGRVGGLLDRLGYSLTLPAEVIVIDDASRDATLAEVLTWADRLENTQTPVVRVIVLRNRWAHFETYCDVVGFRLATAPYVVEVQADMQLDDVGFDHRMISALQIHKDIVAISGRGVHPLSDVRSFRWEPWPFGRRAAQVCGVLAGLRRRQAERQREIPASRHGVVLPEDALFLASGHAGRLGLNIESVLDVPTAHVRRIWIGETVMRGPLAFHRERYEAVGGFDTRRFFLGNDDHDFCARALRIGYRVAFTPVNFVSSLADGTTRQQKSTWTLTRIAALLVRQRLLYRTSGLGQNFRDESCVRVPPEIRVF